MLEWFGFELTAVYRLLRLNYEKGVIGNNNMSVRVMISPALRRFVDCEDEVEVRAGTIASLLTELDRHCSGIAKISSASGKSVNIYVNEKDVRTLMNGQTEVQDGDEVFIVPAISEG